MMQAFTLLLSIAESLLGSRLGQIIIAFTAAWLWSAHDTSKYWKAVIAADKAAAERAYREEIVRQQKAADEINKAAAERAEDSAKIVADMQQVISEYQIKLKEQTHVAPQPKIVRIDACVIDDDFTRVVRKLSTASRRTAKTSRASRRVRKTSGPSAS